MKWLKFSDWSRSSNNNRVALDILFKTTSGFMPKNTVSQWFPAVDYQNIKWTPAGPWNLIQQ